MPKISAVWRDVQARLEAAREVGPREGQQLVEAVLGMGSTERVMAEDTDFPEEKLAQLGQWVGKRLAGMPLGQVLGFAWFYGRRWAVTPEVLIPRPDTEILVEQVLARLKPGDRIAEVGVGTGCIGGTLLAERADVTLLGVDISPAAAEVARGNLEALGVDGRWQVVVGDGLDSVADRFNLIVSNPPYVTDDEWNNLDIEVKDHEPKLALTGTVPNPDGLVFYRRLAAWGRDLLPKDGWLCVEVGWQQGQAVRDLLEEERQQEGAAWVRNFGLQGSGRTGPRGLRAALLGVAVMLAGCSTLPSEKPVGPWPYEFTLGTFSDKRPDDEALLRASVPFTTQSFMTAWQHSVGRSVFSNEPALLDLTLHSYEVTSSGETYALSMDISLRGRDQYGRTLGQMNGRCNAVQRIGFKTLWDFGQQAKDEGTTYPLTATARNATMWQKVMDSCVAELAKQFDTSLAAGRH